MESVRADTPYRMERFEESVLEHNLVELRLKNWQNNHILNIELLSWLSDVSRKMIRKHKLDEINIMRVRDAEKGASMKK